MKKHFTTRSILLATALGLAVGGTILFQNNQTTDATQTLEAAGALQEAGTRFLTQEAAQTRANTRFENASDEIRDLAQAISSGSDLTDKSWEAVSVQDILDTHDSDAQEVGEIVFVTQSSLWREAINFQNHKALDLCIEKGVDVNEDEHALAFTTLDRWRQAADTGENTQHWQTLFDLYLKHGGNVNAEHPAYDMHSLLDHAATTHFDAVDMLIAHGANPWLSPFDPDKIGLPGLLETLSLHAHEPGTLDLIERILKHPNLPEHTKRAKSNLVGNLVHHALVFDQRLELQGVVDRVDIARRHEQENERVRTILNTHIAPQDEDVLRHIPQNLRTTDSGG